MITVKKVLWLNVSLSEILAEEIYPPKDLTKIGFTHISNPSDDLIAANTGYIVEIEYNPETHSAPMGIIIEGAPTLASATISIESLRGGKLSEITQAFAMEMVKGQVKTAGGWNIDARRSGDKNDLQNMQSLHEHMIDYVVADTMVKGADGQLRLCTRADIGAIVRLLREAGLNRYSKKFTLETQIAAAETKAELDLVVW